MRLLGQVLAQAARPVPWPAWDSRLVWATLALVAAILTGALIIAWVGHWRKRTAQQPEPPAERLEDYERLFALGQLSQAELDRIRARLARRNSLPPAPNPPDPPH